MLDLWAAFDIVDHKFVLQRLQHQYGICGTALNWFRSYLSNRTQSVRIQDFDSSAKTLLYGVPQGSVLGPLLFSLFFAPLEDVFPAQGQDPMMYADDTQLYITIVSFDQRPTALSKLELCINDIMFWYTINYLTCNPDKTEIVHFTSRFSSSEVIPDININGCTIPPKPEAGNLAVIIDSHLLLTKHINNICKSSWHAIRNIGKVRRHLDQESCARLVHVFVTSKLDSCNGVLTGLPDKEINKLQNVQNAAARLVAGAKKQEHITPVLQTLRWLPIRARIDFKILLITYKASNNQALTYISELITPHRPPRSLPSSNKNLLITPRFHTQSYGERSFAVAAPRLWNGLPLELKNAETQKLFKSRLKTHLFRKYYNLQIIHSSHFYLLYITFNLFLA